jgi:hypothetical protein
MRRMDLARARDGSPVGPEAEPSDGFPSGPGRSGNHPTGRRLSTRKILGKYHICTMPQKRLLQQTEAWALRQIMSPLMNRIWLHR